MHDAPQSRIWNSGVISTAQSRSARPSGDGRSPPVGVAQRRLGRRPAPPAAAAGPSACRKTRSTAASTVVSGGRPRQRRARRRRQQAIRVRRDVEDVEAQRRVERRADLGARVLDADGAAEAREAAPGDVVDDDRRVADADPVAAAARHAQRAVAGAQAAPSTGVSDDSGVAPAGPISSASAHAGSSASGTFEPVSSTTSQRRVDARHVDVEAARRGVAAGHGARVAADRIGRQLAEHPPRAARQPAREDRAVGQLQRLQRRRVGGADRR